MAERTQRSNILLAFISLTAVIAVVSLIGFFTLGKGPEIIQGQAEADEYRVSGKVPARILELRVKEGDKVPVVLDGGRVAGGHDGKMTPGGIKIKKGKLRGVESFGMMCSIIKKHRLLIRN